MHELTFERTLAPGDPLGIPPESGGSADGRWGLRFENDTLLVLERATGREAARFPGFAARPLAQLDETGAHLAVVRNPREVTIHEIPSGNIVHTFEHPQAVSCLDSAGELLAVGGGDDRLVHIWNTATGQRQRRFSGHDGPVKAVRFRPGGQELVSFADDGRIRVWDAARGVEILRIEEPQLQLAPAWWDDAGSRFFCRRENGNGADTVAVYRFDWSRVAQVLVPGRDEPRSENLPSLTLSADGGLAAAVDEMGCRVWSLRQGRLAAFFPKTNGEWMTAQLTEPSSLWLSGWNQGVRHVSIRNAQTPWPDFDQDERPTLDPGPLLVASRADGGALAFTRNEPSAADDRVEIFWPADERRISLAQVDPYSAALSPDGRFAVTGSFQQPGAQLWSLPEGKWLRTLPYPRRVLSAAFVQDGKTLWLAGDAGVQRVSTDTWALLGDLHREILQFFTVSRDGAIAASLARHEVVLHRTPELSEIARLSVPASAGTIGSATLAFSGDGTRLAIHTAAGSIVVWNLPVLREELRACGMEELPAATENSQNR